MEPIPPLNLNQSSSAKSGDALNYGGFYSGDFTVGGGSALPGGFDIGGLVSQYWPLLAAVGALWYFRHKKA